MSAEPLSPYYREAKEYARELITLIEVDSDNDTDPGRHRSGARSARTSATPRRFRSGC
jgi:hypothetical protein